MAGLDPATQPARVGETKGFFDISSREPFRRVDTRRLGHRLKAGDDELFCIWLVNRTAVGLTRP
jgi:hypothetical protein